MVVDQPRGGRAGAISVSRRQWCISRHTLTQALAQDNNFETPPEIYLHFSMEGAKAHARMMVREAYGELIDQGQHEASLEIFYAEIAKVTGGDEPVMVDLDDVWLWIFPTVVE